MSTDNGGNGDQRFESEDTEFPDTGWLKEIGMSEEQLRRWGQLMKVARCLSAADEHLTFERSLILAKRNAEIYERFLASGAPVKTFEFRIGGERVSTLDLTRPDGAREFMFKRPPGRDTVLQLWRLPDESFDEVPLLFQNLEGISSEGVSRTERYKNGQAITLDVKKDVNGEFLIKLSFGMEEDEGRSDKKASAARVKIKAPRQGMRDWQSCPYPPVHSAVYSSGPYYETRAMRCLVPLIAVGAVFLSFFSLGTYFLGTHQASPTVTRSEAASTPPGEKPTVPAPNTDGAQVTTPPPQLNKSAAPQAGEAGNLLTRRLSPPIRRGEMERVKVQASPTPLSEPSPESAASAVSNSGAAVTVTQATLPGTEEAINKNKQGGDRLADINRVYVESPSDGRLSKKDISQLRAEFIKALQERSDEAVTSVEDKDSADGIVRLRFDPNETNGGVISAALIDSDGLQIWGGKIGCDILADVYSGALLNYASQQLGELMGVTIRQAKSSRDAQTSGPDGGVGEGGVRQKVADAEAEAMKH